LVVSQTSCISYSKAWMESCCQQSPRTWRCFNHG